MIRIQRALVLLCLTLLPAQLWAQPSQEAPWGDRARTFLVLRIAEALKLNEQEALKVGSLIRQSDEHRRDLVQKRQALEQKLRQALAKQPPDAAELTKLIDQGNEIDQKVALVPEDSFHELQKILTVEQQAKFMLFRRELQGEIRHAIQGRGRAGAGRRARGQGSAPPQ